jgi:hypothetical protein
MKVYILIIYDSIFDGESVEGVWLNKDNAEAYKKEYGGLRIEEVEVADAPNKSLNPTSEASAG